MRAGITECACGIAREDCTYHNWADLAKSTIADGKRVVVANPPRKTNPALNAGATVVAYEFRVGDIVTPKAPHPSHGKPFRVSSVDTGIPHFPIGLERDKLPGHMTCWRPEGLEKIANP